MANSLQSTRSGPENKNDEAKLIHFNNNGLPQVAIFTMQNVFFRYSRKTSWVLSGASLAVRPGERIGIIGENGAGKSTIAKLLVGFITPNQGTVKLFGKSVSWQQHFPKLGYIGDPSHIEGETALPNDLTVSQIITVHNKLFLASGEIMPEAKNLLSGFGLQDPHIWGSKIGNLSKGQRQRVLVYLALAKGPSLLIADEGTEGMDAKSRHLILEEVTRAVSLRHMTVIWISHRFDDIASMTDSVYELREGKLIPHKSELFNCQVKINGQLNEKSEMSAASILHHFGQLVLAESTVELNFSACRIQGVTNNDGDR